MAVDRSLRAETALATTCGEKWMRRRDPGDPLGHPASLATGDRPQIRLCAGDAFGNTYHPLGKLHRQSLTFSFFLFPIFVSSALCVSCTDE